MRLAPALLASTALCAPATAQELEWTWLAEVEHPVLDPSKGLTTQTVTLSVLMEYPAPWVVIAFTSFDTLGFPGAYNGAVTDWQVLNDLDVLVGDDVTSTDGVSLFGTHALQLCDFGPCTTDNPIEVFQFTWEVVAEGPYEVSYFTDTFDALAWVGEDQDTAESLDAVIVNEAVFGWVVVPAPPAALVLAIVAGARRRQGGAS